MNPLCLITLFLKSCYNSIAFETLLTNNILIYNRFKIPSQRILFLHKTVMVIRILSLFEIGSFSSVSHRRNENEILKVIPISVIKFKL